MFYFAIFHSSVSAGKDLDKKTLTTFLYGCVLYIIFHALLSTSERPFFKMIQSYFWIIMAIDIVCMLYIYVKILKPMPSDSGGFVVGLKEKFTGLLDNIIDTSMYSTNIEMPAYHEIDTNHAVPYNRQPYNHPGTDAAKGILKKSVIINEDHNEVKEIEANIVHEPENSISHPAPQDDNGETDDINSQLVQFTDSAMNFNSPEQPMDRKRDLLAERAMTNLIPAKPAETPKALQSTSIDEIRKRTTSLNTNTVKSMNTKSVLANRTELTNSQLSALNLNYNPDELVSDVLNRPKFEKGTEPLGVASSRLNKNTLQPGTDIWNNKKISGADILNANNNIKKNDDSASIASDVGSMLDFDLTEFAQTI
jgi:hypothetical protein